MEFLPFLGLILAVYAAFVLLFFRFLIVTHRKEEALARHGDKGCE
jgi:hypothetical protein